VVEGAGGGQAAKSLHLLCIVRSDLPARSRNAQAVQELEEVTADRGNEATGLSLARRPLRPVGDMRLRLLRRFFDRLDAQFPGERRVGDRAASDISPPAMK
jgi:hypothetical protein